MNRHDNHPENRVAVVIIPTGTHSTHLIRRETPTQIDFDRLWSQAIAPALVELGYEPRRLEVSEDIADQPELIKEILSSNLILVDIHLSHGHVVYDAASLGKTRPAGCVVIGPHWADEKYSLERRRQLRYTLSSDAPTQDEYHHISETLVDNVPKILSVSQSTLIDKILPNIQHDGVKFQKNTMVHARPGIPGEVIVTSTSGGRETENITREGDYVVRNITEAAECYVVPSDLFLQRYEVVEEVDETWTSYQSHGEILALPANETASALGMTGTFYIMARWGSSQIVVDHDVLASPLPALDEIYRIAANEFEQTYHSAEELDDQEKRDEEE